MTKEDIRISKVIMHIMDTNVGMPVLSNQLIEFGSDLADFLREHIYKIASGDDGKQCEFHQQESEIFRLLDTYDDENFIEISRKIAEYLYEIMHANVEIPSADLMVVRFRIQEFEYLALLKMNYKEFYTHRTLPGEDGTSYNELFKYRSILPSESQRLQEAAVICLNDLNVRVVERKYEVNGEKTNYFSYLFLKCKAKLSDKTKLNIVTKAIENIQKDNYDESMQYAVQMKAKEIIHETLEEQGSFSVREIAEKVFEEKPELNDVFQEKMEKYDMVREEVAPKSERTMRKYETQHLMTDTGIEIRIPMDQYKDPDSVEFITNPDGTVSVLIKNIGHIQARF